MNRLVILLDQTFPYMQQNHPFMALTITTILNYLLITSHKTALNKCIVSTWIINLIWKQNFFYFSCTWMISTPRSFIESRHHSVCQLIPLKVLCQFNASLTSKSWGDSWNMAYMCYWVEVMTKAINLNVNIIASLSHSNRTFQEIKLNISITGKGITYDRFQNSQYQKNPILKKIPSKIAAQLIYNLSSRWQSNHYVLFQNKLHNSTIYCSYKIR